MNNYKSPYDSTQIREGLMNIKQSQMQLLRQLKNQNHLLKKYTPENPIYEQKSDSNFYQSSSPSYSIKQNFQSNLGSNSKPNYESYLSSNQKDFVDTVKLNSKNENTHTLERQLQAMTEEFHRMKKNYFNEKQKNKDMVLHMEFAASLHNLILKEVLQGGNLQSIKSKVRSEVQSYQSEFPEFKAFGLQQAFNIVNLQSDIPFAESRVTNRRTQIFQPKMPQQNSQLLKQLNDLKCQLRQISLQKQRKTQQVTLMRSQNDYTVSLLNKELQMKNGKINELVSQILKQKESLNYLNSQNSDLRSNIDRLKGQLQRNFNKIELLQSQQRKTTQTIQKQHKYMKYLKELQDKVSFLERQSREKSKLIQIHQQNVSKSTQQAKSFKNDTQRLKSQLSDTKQSLSKKTTQIIQLQQKIDSMTASHSQKLTLINKRNQTQQSSLKQHIQQLKKNLQILLKQQESYKLSQQALLQIKQKKIQNIKLSKTVDHLWKIKEVEYQNINTVLTQLNLIKSVNEAHYIGQNAYQLKKQPVSARNDGSKVKSSSKSKEKHRRR